MRDIMIAILVLLFLLAPQVVGSLVARAYLGFEAVLEEAHSEPRRE